MLFPADSLMKDVHGIVKVGSQSLIVDAAIRLYLSEVHLYHYGTC